MEFCPRCKNAMFPRDKGGKITLICHKCGHEIKKFSEQKYKMTEETRHKRKDIIIVDSSTGGNKEELIRYHDDLYGTDTEFEE